MQRRDRPVWRGGVGAGLLVVSLLLAGCEDQTKVQLKQQVQEQQAQIADLQSKLDAAINGEEGRIAAAQSMINLAFAYTWSAPLRGLPIWNRDAVRQGQLMLQSPPKQQTAQGITTIAPALQPDWAGYGLLAVLWAGMAAILGAFAAAFWVVVQRLRHLLQIRRIEDALAAKRRERQQLATLQQERDDARNALKAARAQTQEAAAEIETLQGQIAALKQRKATLHQDIEQGKADVLQAYRRELEAQQAKSQQIARAIEKGLEGL